MIAIINREGPDDGVCTYTVGINRRILATFTHDRRDGLAFCLRKAAEAVEKVNPEGGHLCPQCKKSVRPLDGPLCLACRMVNLYNTKEDYLWE